jgi:hypothetical protein
MDYWNAPGHFGPWAGGYFGGFGGLDFRHLGECRRPGLLDGVDFLPVGGA